MKLKAAQRDLLLEILKRHGPELAAVFQQPDGPNLKSDDILMALDCVTAELCASGLREDDEPNEYGLLLEDLIGELSLELQNLDRRRCG